MFGFTCNSLISFTEHIYLSHLWQLWDCPAETRNIYCEIPAWTGSNDAFSEATALSHFYMPWVQGWPKGEVHPAYSTKSCFTQRYFQSLSVLSSQRIPPVAFCTRITLLSHVSHQLSWITPDPLTKTVVRRERVHPRSSLYLQFVFRITLQHLPDNASGNLKNLPYHWI